MQDGARPHTLQTWVLISCMRRLIFVWCHVGFLNVMGVANCGRLIARIFSIFFMGILERGSVRNKARKWSAAQGPHSEVVPRAFWRLVSKSCDTCKGSFAWGCEAKRWSQWTCSSLWTIFQPLRINSVTGVKFFCNDKNVLCTTNDMAFRAPPCIYCCAGAWLSTFFCVLYFSLSIPSGAINADVEICPWWVITHSCCLRANTCDLNKSHVLRNGTTWCHGNLHSSGKLCRMRAILSQSGFRVRGGRWDHLPSNCQ